MNDKKTNTSRYLKSVLACLVGIPVIYLLSSGPVLGLAFWLREATGLDEFYYVLYLYLPLFYFGHDSLVMYYIEWWVVDVFHTVGPG